MKILILNGSPRLKGNTSYALSVILDGIINNTQHEVETVNVTKLKVSGCSACDACRSNGGDCVMKDDTKSIIDKVYAADAIIFGTPVYWSGMSAQMKAVIDKFYSKTVQLMEKSKKVGVVAIGTGIVSNKQYELIHDQVRNFCKFLDWDMKFNLSYSANAPDDLRKMESAADELMDAWKALL